jgi:hypothetical protein
MSTIDQNTSNEQMARASADAGASNQNDERNVSTGSEADSDMDTSGPRYEQGCPNQSAPYISICGPCMSDYDDIRFGHYVSCK